MSTLQENPAVAFNLPGGQPTAIIVSVAILVLISVLYRAAYDTNVPKILGIPELPSALPFIGHLHLHAGASGLGNDAALWIFWSKKLGSDLLQVKWGNRRVVIASSFHSIKEIFVTNASSTNARPRAHIFEKYVGYDLGSYSLEAHSLDGNFKTQRTAAIKSAAPRNFASFYPCLDREGDRVIANLAVQGEYGKTAINPLSYMQVVAMAVAWSITFDKQFEVNDPWLRKYIDNASLITKVRGASNTWCDFVPFLRLHPKFRSMGAEAKRSSTKRSAMVQEVLEGLKKRLDNGEEPNCIAASCLADKNSKLTMWDATKASTSMLQGGTESIPSSLTAGMGGLIQGDGFAMQEKAYQAIMKAYPNGDAIKHAFTEEKVPYIVALYKEILRNYVVLPFALPHLANEDVRLKSGILIPKGTTLYMNSEGGNHDESVFGPTAHEFNPQRWLDNPELDSIGTVPHSTYGIGSRICPAWQISNRIMYGLLFRIILAFRLEADPSNLPPKDYRSFGSTPDTSINVPTAFKVKFVPRNTGDLASQVAVTRARERGKI